MRDFLGAFPGGCTVSPAENSTKKNSSGVHGAGHAYRHPDMERAGGTSLLAVLLAVSEPQDAGV